MIQSQESAQTAKQSPTGRTNPDGGCEARVSVVIPNWNGAEHLPRCLDSLYGQSLDAIDVTVVDNGSSDGSLELLADRYPEVRVLPLGENRGFAGACNAGMRLAVAPVTVLLNNDTEADPRWLEEVLAAFERHPEAGMVASKMLLFDRRDTFHTAGDFYRVDGLPGNRGVWQRDEGQYDEEEYVFGACGGSAAYRGAMLEQVGLLDEDFFFSCEDVDIAWRAQLSGWRCIYAPRAVVYHKLSATGGGATASFYDGRNAIYLLIKDYPTNLWRRYWRAIISRQMSITREAVGAWQGAAARARLRGQLSGLVTGLVRMLPKRRAIQRSRTVDRAYLERVLTAIDERPHSGYHRSS